MTPADELRIRAYLGDAEARAALALDGPGEIADLLQDGMLPLTPEFEPTAKRLLADLMRRARTNVELLWERLQRAGYLFYETGYYPPAKDAATQLDEFERATGRCVPLAYRAWVEIVGEVSFMGTHPGWPAITYNGLGGSGNAACSDPLVVQWSLRYLLDQWAD
ncbi:MAG TPA: hypothetical protein VGE52_07935, partial [Pirellulales bacterium]